MGGSCLLIAVLGILSANSTIAPLPSRTLAATRFERTHLRGLGLLLADRFRTCAGGSATHRIFSPARLERDWSCSATAARNVSGLLWLPEPIASRFASTRPP